MKVWSPSRYLGWIFGEPSWTIVITVIINLIFMILMKDGLVTWKISRLDLRWTIQNLPQIPLPGRNCHTSPKRSNANANRHVISKLFSSEHQHPSATKLQVTCRCLNCEAWLLASTTAKQPMSRETSPKGVHLRCDTFSFYNDCESQSSIVKINHRYPREHLQLGSQMAFPFYLSWSLSILCADTSTFLHGEKFRCSATHVHIVHVSPREPLSE